VIIYNYAGIIITAIGFAAAFGVGAIVGSSAEGPLMMIAGPSIALLDLAYRFKLENGHWFIPHRGGSLFFLPVWLLGALWFVLGIVYIVGGGG
jgi:hypothetical protein